MRTVGLLMSRPSWSCECLVYHLNNNKNKYDIRPLSQGSRRDEALELIIKIKNEYLQRFE